MKTFLSFFCIALLCGCVSTQSRIPGQTFVNVSPSLRRDAVRAVATYEMALSPYEGSLRVVDTQIITPPGNIGAERNTGMADTMWVERWIIKRGGTNFAYRVMFDVRGSQGTGITVGFDEPSFPGGPSKICNIP